MNGYQLMEHPWNIVERPIDMDVRGLSKHGKEKRWDKYQSYTWNFVVVIGTGRPMEELFTPERLPVIVKKLFSV
jgi:hypothetical protein